MKRTLLRNVTLYTRNLLRNPNPSPSLAPLAALTRPRLRFFSSENDSSGEKPSSAPEMSLAQPQKKDAPIAVEDVSGENPSSAPETSLAKTQKKDALIAAEDVNNKELKVRIENYFKGDEEALPSILEAILQRKLTGKHEETDDELMEELRMKPLDNVKDKEFESDFEEMHETDEEIDDLYNARDIVTKKMVKDEFFNMDDRKWDGLVKEAIQHKVMKDTRECEEILEDMLRWNSLLPDEIKKKVEERFNELGDMCERGEIEPEEAYELFKKFEDEMVMECTKIMEAEGPSQFDEIAVPDKKKDSGAPPGEGPILRWQTRVVFAPGGDAWHPKKQKSENVCYCERAWAFKASIPSS